MKDNGTKLDDLDFHVLKEPDLTEAERVSIHQLFDYSYQNANHPYLEKLPGILKHPMAGNKLQRTEI